MQTWLKISGAVALVVVSFLVTNETLERLWPTCPAGGTELKRPFQKALGVSYVKEGLSTSGDGPGLPTKSTLLLCEDRTILGPMHTAHAEIAMQGKGRYSHWVTSIVFSASDNSDPNTNGRTYKTVQP